ncbi:MAG: TonB family protein [Bacteriovoracales bacterium]|nr:TonB family protein [Bacteriovoracales bacterium]
MVNAVKSHLKSGYWPFVLFSLVLHLLAMSIPFDLSFSKRWKAGKIPYQAIEIIRIEDFKKKDLGKKPPRQIVRSDQTGRAEKDPQARFLGKTTQSFEKQSVAKSVGPYQKGGRLRSRGDRNVSSGQKALDKGRIHLSDLGTVAVFDGKRLGEKGEKGEKDREDSSGNRNGRFRTVASSSDFIEDIPLGDMTRLNTVEFKYFGFYERIRKRLEQFWGFSLRRKVMALEGSSKEIESNGRYITSLIVTIDQRGKITKVHLEHGSGVQELDDAAIDSFNKAGPFPNPPRGMLKKGKAKIKWSFIVQS